MRQPIQELQEQSRGAPNLDLDAGEGFLKSEISLRPEG